MGLSDLVDQVLIGAPKHKVLYLLKAEVVEVEVSKYKNLLHVIHNEAFQKVRELAISDGQMDANIVCTKDRAQLADLFVLQAQTLEDRKRQMIADFGKWAAEFGQGLEEHLVSCGQNLDVCKSELGVAVQTLEHKVEVKFIHEHAVRLGLLLWDEVDAGRPNPKWAKMEPQSQTAVKAVAGVRSWLASVCSEMCKRECSASPPALSKPLGITLTDNPSSKESEEDDITPTPSPVVALPLVQMVDQIFLPVDAPSHFGVHMPGNQMVVDPLTATPPSLSTQPVRPVGATEHTMSQAIDVALNNKLTPILEAIAHLTKAVEAKACAPPPTVPKIPQPHSLVAAPAASSKLQMRHHPSVPDNALSLKMADWGADLVEDIGADDDFPSLPEVSKGRKATRKANDKAAKASANSTVPGALPPDDNSHIPLRSQSCIALTFACTHHNGQGHPTTAGY